MKKLISILMIAALAGFIAVGCSTPEDQGKTGATAGAPATTSGTDSKTSDTPSTDSGKMDEKKGDAPAAGGAPAGGAPAGGAPAGGDAPKMDEKK